MVFDPPRPRRRPWRWLVPLVLVIAALVALAASGEGTRTRDEIDYVNAMAEQIEEIALGGASLREVVPRISSIDRAEWEAVIGSLSSHLATAHQFAQAEPPTTELVAINALYRLALDAWVEGVEALGTGILAAADDPSDSGVVSRLAEAILRLRAGDALHADLLDELDRLGDPDPITPFRPVTLSPGEGVAVTLAVGYTLAARSADNNLALRPGLAVSQLVADPEWQINPDKQVVMPATEEAVFSVVISNLGNLVSVEEQVVLTLTGIDEPSTMTLPVEALAPGAQTTLVFDPLPITPGETYEVAAEIQVTDIDADFEDNVIRVVFLVNPE